MRVEAKQLGETITQKNPLVLQFILHAVNRGLETSLDNGYEIESGLFGVCLASDEAKKGMDAFITKRPLPNKVK